MREFKSLFPKGLSEDFDALIHGEEPIVSVDESNRRITISYTFPGFYLSGDSEIVDGAEIQFQQVNIEGTGKIGANGKPQLPSFGRYVQIPFGCDYKFSIYKDDPVEYDDVLVKPAQSELTDNPNQEYSFAYDKSLYATDELFPAELMTVSPPVEIDEYIALLVHVCPFQYNPVKKKLIGYAKIEVTIDIIEKEGDLGEHPFPDPEGGLDGFGNLFLNPGRSIERRLSVDPPLERIPARLGKTGPELLIVYPQYLQTGSSKTRTLEEYEWTSD